MWSSLLLVELSSRISSRSLTPSKKPARSRSGIWIAHCYFVVISRNCNRKEKKRKEKKQKLAVCLWITLLLWKKLWHCKYGHFELQFLVISFGKLVCLWIALLLWQIVTLALQVWPLELRFLFVSIRKFWCSWIFLHCFCFYLEIVVLLNSFTLLQNIMPLITHCIMYYYSTFDYLAMLLL